jgi:ABC-type molybdate transport system substrate-binding protein
MTGKEQAAARSFIGYISSAPAAAAFKARGFEPSGQN